MFFNLWNIFWQINWSPFKDDKEPTNNWKTGWIKKNQVNPALYVWTVPQNSQMVDEGKSHIQLFSTNTSKQNEGI